MVQILFKYKDLKPLKYIDIIFILYYKYFINDIYDKWRQMT